MAPHGLAGPSLCRGNGLPGLVLAGHAEYVCVCVRARACVRACVCKYATPPPAASNTVGAADQAVPKWTLGKIGSQASAGPSGHDDSSRTLADGRTIPALIDLVQDETRKRHHLQDDGSQTRLSCLILHLCIQCTRHSSNL